MAQDLLPFFNAFSSALETLKIRCEDNPTRLALLVANDEEVRKTAGRGPTVASKWQHRRALDIDVLPDLAGSAPCDPMKCALSGCSSDPTIC
jgi:hypothetical protein